MRRITLVMFLAVAMPRLASAQSAARYELVRCVAFSDVPCLRATSPAGGASFTIPAGADGIAGLGRTATLTVARMKTMPDTAVSVPVSWRPPLVAMPSFRGVADSSALSPAVREALMIGAAGSGDRLAIALLVAIIVAVTWLSLARFGAPPFDVAGPAHESGTLTRAEAAPGSGAEADPRHPDEATKQTARGTALRR